MDGERSLLRERGNFSPDFWEDVVAWQLDRLVALLEGAEHRGDSEVASLPPLFVWTSCLVEAFSEAAYAQAFVVGAVVGAPLLAAPVPRPQACDT